MMILIHDMVMDAFQVLVVPFADGRIDVFAVDAAVPVFSCIHPGLGKDATVEILVDLILAVFGIVAKQFAAFHIVVGQVASQIILLASLRRPAGNIFTPGYSPVDNALFQDFQAFFAEFFFQVLRQDGKETGEQNKHGNRFIHFLWFQVYTPLCK